MEDSDSKVYQSAKSVVYNSFLETPEAKAVKVMRLSDPDFDIYVMELELSRLVRNMLDKALNSDIEYVKKGTEGSALEYLSKISALQVMNLEAYRSVRSFLRRSAVIWDLISRTSPFRSSATRLRRNTR